MPLREKTVPIGRSPEFFTTINSIKYCLSTCIILQFMNTQIRVLMVYTCHRSIAIFHYTHLSQAASSNVIKCGNLGC